MFSTADSEDNITQGTSFKRKPSLPSTSNERDSPESSQVVKQNINRDLTLNMLVKEFVFCIALALTTYGALHNAPTKVSKVPQAVRFFYSDSVVTDWYRGQLSNALASIHSEDVSFVMYYAPWDAESQYVRGEFDKAANILSDRVHFAAINCWNPGSECRLQHSKIPSWPILVAYTVTSRGVLYKGPRNAESMVNFLELIMRPLQKISNTEDLVNLLSICDAVAVGFTPLTDTSRYYNIWYNVALKSYEFDTIGEICFAAVTSAELASDLGVESIPNARLMLWNDTKEYKPEDNKQSWNETFLVNWVLENFAQPVARIIPMWKKSFNFERYADGNPMLILFTPLNPIYEQLPSYTLLREVAMEYYNCKNNGSNQWTSELIKLQQVQRQLYQKKNFLKFCQEYKFKKPVKKQSLHYRKVVSHNNKYPWNNVTQKNQKASMVNFLLKQGMTLSKLIENSNDDSALWSDLGFLEHCGESASHSLPAEKSFYENYEKCQSFEEQLNGDLEMEQEDVETTMLPYEDDPLSAENLMQENVKHFCRLMQFANKISPPVSPAKVSNGNVTHLHGLACDTNYTLHMIAVDSIRNYHFAEALGVDIKNRKDMTAAVILDSRYESQYVLSGEYSAKSVRDFISNFTQQRLKRTLRSRIDDAKHTHYFGSGAGTEPDGKDENAVHITDLTTHTFRKFVTTPGTVSLVAVCGGGCGALVARALAHAARLLRASGVRARAARLDALRHDLPWQYTAHAYPTLLVFPAHRGGEAESRAFPSGERVSGSGVVALALRSLGAPTHLRVSLALCAPPTLSSERKACLKDVREHVTTLISRNLKYWRRTQVRELRDCLFRRLQHLHDVALHISLLHITDLSQNNAKQKTLLKSLDNLSKNWNIDESILRKNIIPSPITR
ncbi:thioredoxin domain-containing protein 11 [Maniola hyperantus]|uniref:thioredoxin domain-containing protein 11 n=1 Tax=Aphantopus hyperantus TaxID=2795564 RepID=UPI0015689B67|nr:thioredoxin domain-containing protein 11 [Maniola hyperantus]